MLKGLPQRNPGAAYQRKVAAERRFPPGSRCACGETRPESFVSKNPVVCAACDRVARGQTTLDDHHSAGESNSPITVPIPVNDHRAELSPAQYDWPKATLENRNGSPLLARAACIRGYIDTNSYLVEKLLRPNAEFCELMDQILTQEFGPEWWRDPRFEKFKSERW
jgi:hypothetical protein